MTEKDLDQSVPDGPVADREDEPDETHAEGYLRRYEHRPEYLSRRRDQQIRFLLALPVVRTDVAAAGEAGVSVDTVQRWKREDDWFQRAYADADARVGDVVYRAMWKLAVDGVDKPVLYRGEVVAHVREWDSRLLDKLMGYYFPGWAEGKPAEGAAAASGGQPERPGGMWIPAEKLALLKPTLQQLGVLEPDGD